MEVLGDALLQLIQCRSRRDSQTKQVLSEGLLQGNLDGTVLVFIPSAKEQIFKVIFAIFIGLNELFNLAKLIVNLHNLRDFGSTVSVVSDASSVPSEGSSGMTGGRNLGWIFTSQISAIAFGSSPFLYLQFFRLKCDGRNFPSQPWSRNEKHTWLEQHYAISP